MDSLSLKLFNSKLLCFLFLPLSWLCVRRLSGGREVKLDWTRIQKFWKTPVHMMLLTRIIMLHFILDFLWKTAMKSKYVLSSQSEPPPWKVGLLLVQGGKAWAVDFGLQEAQKSKGNRSSVWRPSSWSGGPWTVRPDTLCWHQCNALAQHMKTLCLDWKGILCNIMPTTSVSDITSYNQ